MEVTGLLDRWVQALGAWWFALPGFFVYDPQAPMIFNSESFLLFFLVFFGGYLFLAHATTLRLAYITAFSLFFYYKSSGNFYLLLLISSFIDYTFGLLIDVYQRDDQPTQTLPLPRGQLRLIHIFPDSIGGGSDSSSWSGRLDNAVVLLSALPIRFLQLLFELFVTLVDWCTHWLVSPDNPSGKRKLYLMLSIFANLGILAYFKYTNFFIDTINVFLAEPLNPMHIFLPVGISFFTFQTMSYSIDVYRGKLEPVRNFLDFTFYVTFFPQLVAGPIVRAADFLPQIRQRLQVSQEDMGRGLMLISTGLFKKAVISDYISVNFVDRVFENPALYTGFENLMGTYGYALQIYCDFSGYTDMAIGIGLLLGYRLPLNFAAPYQSSSIREFWRRWHISLSSWLRDYLYISLGGNRFGPVRTYVNLVLTMVLGGLWHGASWQFVLWGTLHGGALALDRLLSDTRAALAIWYSRLLDRLDEWALEREAAGGSDRIAQWLMRWRWLSQGWLSLVLSVAIHLGGVFFTFHFVCLCWIFFRADTYELAWEMIYQILNNFDWSVAWPILTGYREVFLLMLLGYVLHFLPEDVDRFFELRFMKAYLPVKAVILAAVIWVVVEVGAAGVQPFIYFQF
ncbi:MAG: hypothetical protein OHK0039_19210 [Bacteroidia bacterium]